MHLYARLTARFPILARLPVRELKHHWLTVSFFVGFIVDNFTLNRVDQLFDNLVLAAYVFLAMGSMLALYAALAGKVPERFEEPLRKYAPLVTQYSFGGLLSGMLIFYGRSGAWLASWPYLLIIIGVIVGNELLTKRGDRLVFNLTIFFIGLFSYLVLVVPVFLGMMGAWLFVLSGVLALVVFSAYLKLLRLVIPNFLRANQRLLVFSIGIIYALLNVLYFTNVIPPIPLSLKELGIYHSVERVESGDYALTYERGSWYEFFRRSDETFHYQLGDTVYCFASVFAPTRLETEIYHRFEYYVPEHKEWRTHGRFSYAIEGGRDGGFRGYTSVMNVTPGTWRCTVETARKQILGRETFEIVAGAPERGLVTELR
jgi:hypothetical protein